MSRMSFTPLRAVVRKAYHCNGNVDRWYRTKCDIVDQIAGLRRRR